MCVLQHRHTADRISQRMTAEGHKVASLHGAKDAAERDAIIDAFRQGKDKVRIPPSLEDNGNLTKTGFKGPDYDKRHRTRD